MKKQANNKTPRRWQTPWRDGCEGYICIGVMSDTYMDCTRDVPHWEGTSLEMTKDLQGQS
jgi:hypothetical protein